LKCPNCGEEILDEDVTFCPNCGNPIKLQPQRSDYLLAAATLTLIAAAFSAGLASIALYEYNYWFSIYGSSGRPEIFGFLIFGISNIVASAFAVAGATFMLKRKSVRLSLSGVILLLVSAIVTYLSIYQNGLLEPIIVLGVTGAVFLSETAMIMLSILSAILVYKSRDKLA
jgi:hypothetical protein